MNTLLVQFKNRSLLLSVAAKATALVVLCCTGAPQQSFAADVMGTYENGKGEGAKLNIETHSFLIDKLEKVIASTPVGDSTRIPSMLRIADIYSERARLLFMEAMKNAANHPDQASDLNSCKACNSDRSRAIDFYEMALKESLGNVKRETESRILFQLAYLYEATGKEARATELYKQILKKGAPQFSQTVLGQSEAGLAELDFRNKRFASAKRWYTLALTRAATPRKGWLSYRIAWCDFNLGEEDDARNRLVKILKTPALLALNSKNPNQPDPTFQEDVARDLAVFLARIGFSEADLRLLSQLSPKGSKVSILISLAEETERLGQRKRAIAVWQAIVNSTEKELDARTKIEASARITYLQYGLHELDAAVTEMQRGLTIWKKKGCEPDAECKVLERRFRKFVLDWNKSEETEPTLKLLGAYEVYTSFFVKDAEMAYWGANVARELDKPGQAVALYRRAAVAAKGMIESKPEIKKIFEDSLIAEIEMAEATGKDQIRVEAYENYLSLNPQGDREFEVKYQLAHIQYSQGKTKKSAETFYKLARLDSECSSERRKICAEFTKKLGAKSADLALDAQAQLKNDKQIEEWAIELGSLYSSRKTEFAGIARRARLNLAAKAAASGSTAEMRANLEKLHNLDLSGAPKDEVLLAARNQFVLAEKVNDFAEAEAASKRELAVSGLNEKEKEEAKSRQLWVYEMQLRFSEAYGIAKTMALSQLSPAEREVKLGLLAELAGLDARTHLKKAIQSAQNQEQANAARVNLIRISGYSTSEWNQYKDQLKTNPRQFAQIGFEVFAKTGSSQVMKEVLANKKAADTAEGAALVRIQNQAALKQLLATRGQIAKASIQGKNSDKENQKSIQVRVQWLTQAEKTANKLVGADEPLSEAAGLSLIAAENAKLAKEIRELPAPKGLKPADQKAYVKLLDTQVKPFETKAEKIEAKIKAFADNKSTQKMIDELADLRGQKLKVIEASFEPIATGFDMSQSASAQSLARKLKSAFDAAKSADEASKNLETRSLVKDVRENPLSVSAIRKLRDAEERKGKDSMVAYLDHRLRAFQTKEKDSK